MPLAYCTYQIMWFVWKYFVNSLPMLLIYFFNCLALEDTYGYLPANLYECILW